MLVVDETSRWCTRSKRNPWKNFLMENTDSDVSGLFTKRNASLRRHYPVQVVRVFSQALISHLSFYVRYTRYGLVRQMC